MRRRFDEADARERELGQIVGRASDAVLAHATSLTPPIQEDISHGAIGLDPAKRAIWYLYADGEAQAEATGAPTPSAARPSPSWKPRGKEAPSKIGVWVRSEKAVEREGA